MLVRLQGVVLLLALILSAWLTGVSPARAAEFTVPSQATTLPFDRPTEGHVRAGSDRWFVMTIPNGAVGSFVVVDLEGLTPDIDIDMTLTDRTGHELSSSVSRYRHERVFARIPANRQIAVRVFIYQPENSTNPQPPESDFSLHAYTLAQQPLGPFAPTLPPAFTDLVPGQAASGMVRGAPAWFRYHITDTGTLRIEFEGEGLRVALLVEDGSEVFQGTASSTPLQVDGDANTYTDFFVKVSGSGSYSFTGNLLAIAPPATSEGDASSTPGEQLWGHSGSLGTGDLQRADGSFYEYHTVPVRAGERIRISLASADFDPYLIVADPEGKRLVNDDISENDRNSRIEMTPSAGTIEITASSYAGNVSGQYDLTVERLRIEPASVPRTAAPRTAAPAAAASVPPAAVDTIPILTVLFNGRDAATWDVDSPTALTISPRGNPVLVSTGKLFDLTSRRFLSPDTRVSQCVYTPSGALLAVSGRSLGYYAGGVFHPQVSLPESGMKLAASRNGLYVFGGERSTSSGLRGMFGGSRSTNTGLYFIDPDRGTVKICDMPQPIGAAAATGDTLFFTVANDIYRLVPGHEMQLICRVPGPAITSLSVSDTSFVFFTAGRTLYVWREGHVRIIAEDIGDIVAWHHTGLYVLDTTRRNLVRFKNLWWRN